MNIPIIHIYRAKCRECSSYLQSDEDYLCKEYFLKLDKSVLGEG